jgi:hypothetical protein
MSRRWCKSNRSINHLSHSRSIKALTDDLIITCFRLKPPVPASFYFRTGLTSTGSKLAATAILTFSSSQRSKPESFNLISCVSILLAVRNPKLTVREDVSKDPLSPWFDARD